MPSWPFLLCFTDRRAHEQLVSSALLLQPWAAVLHDGLLCICSKPLRCHEMMCSRHLLTVYHYPAFSTRFSLQDGAMSLLCIAFLLADGRTTPCLPLHCFPVGRRTAPRLSAG